MKETNQSKGEVVVVVGVVEGASKEGALILVSGSRLHANRGALAAGVTLPPWGNVSQLERKLCLIAPDWLLLTPD